MKINLAVMLGIVLGALIIGHYWYSHRTKSALPELSSTDKIVQTLASEAVKDALSNNQIKLDYSVDSIKRVDEILGRFHDDYRKAPTSISLNGLSAAYGAYLGEVIRRTEANTFWKRDDVFGEKVYALEWNRSSVFPMAWCQHRIENGDEDNVWMKYTVFKGMHAKAGS